MTTLEAIKARHSVRHYTEMPLEQGIIDKLNTLIAECNTAGGLHLQLVVNEPKAFSTSKLSYGKFSGVNNYLVVAGPKGGNFAEAAGYYGEKVVLYAQTLGLNSCWVGLTYKKIPEAFELKDGEKVYCVVCLGYGADSGVQHPLRSFDKVAETNGDAPQWFKDGVDAVILAPSAINQQKYKFILAPDGSVRTRTSFSIAGYTDIDLGIAEYHFEVASGKKITSFE